MTPEQVTQCMWSAADLAFCQRGFDLDAAIAAAINAMPDDLLLKIAVDRGYVVVPKKRCELFYAQKQEGVNGQ